MFASLNEGARPASRSGKQEKKLPKKANAEKCSLMTGNVAPCLDYNLFISRSRSVTYMFDGVRLPSAAAAFDVMNTRDNLRWLQMIFTRSDALRN